MVALKRPVVAIILFGLLLELPLLLWGPLAGGHDTNEHLAWYTQFSRQFWSGELYPRWLMGANAGLGSPTFFVYAPGPYLIAALLRPFFGILPIAYAELTVSIILAAISAGLATYFWLRNLVPDRAALVAALIYMAMPYHLWADNYFRFALAEFWAMTWMPFTLCFVQRLIKGRNFSIVGLALSYGMLTITHLFTTLIFSPLLLASALFMAPKNSRVRVAISTCAALAIGICFSAVYVAPALDHEKYISAKDIAVGVYSYQNNFLLIGTTLLKSGSRPMWWHCSWIAIDMAILVVGCTTIFGRYNRETEQVRPFWWLTAAVVALLMTFPVSTPVWRALPILQDINFPWRFLAVLSVAVCPLVAAVHLRRPTCFVREPGVYLCAVAIAPWLLAYSHVWYLYHVNGPLPHDNTELVVSADWIRAVWCKSCDSRHLIPSVMKQTVEEKPPVSIASGLGSATILSWKPREILIRTDAPRATSIILRQFYYPKWIAFDASSKSFLKVEPIAPEGLTRVTIPACEHEIRVSLPRDLAERLGSYASWGSIMALIAMAWNSTRRGRGQAKTCRASAELLDQSIFPDSDEEIDR